MKKNDNLILSTDLPGLSPFQKGKVRDIYDLGDKLLIVATDRISAFDVILPNGIPDKGRILTGLSAYWFEFTKDVVPNHLLSAEADEFPEELRAHKDILSGRTMLVKKAKVIPVECVVRGYLAGSGWKDYLREGEVCGVKLPKGLKESERLPEPIFTPATKAFSGHDINITFEQVIDLVGKEIAEELRTKSLAIYQKTRGHAEDRGIIIADTKFEFGEVNGQIILIDELLTPDSSRFWDKEDYCPGRAQRSFDKQFVRDYLEGIKWNKEPPAPKLPPEVVEKTREKYLEAYRRITGRDILKNKK